jgi:hypothetical protein
MARFEIEQSLASRRRLTKEFFKLAMHKVLLQHISANWYEK